jgi:hypothetical protein
MRPITDILREIRRGRAVDQATRLLSEVVLAVDETGKPGEVTITIKVKPAKEGGSEKTLQAIVKAKVPNADIPEAVFFSDQSGDLHRADPAQSEMELRDVSRGGGSGGGGGSPGGGTGGGPSLNAAAR